VEAALAAGIEIPVFCYEPRLGAPIGACRMCLCEITPGPPKPQAACTLQAADGVGVEAALTSAGAPRGHKPPPQFSPLHPPRNRPGDLPRVRKGRGVPAAGPAVPLRPGQPADDVPEADVRQADPDLTADRARP